MVISIVRSERTGRLLWASLSVSSIHRLGPLCHGGPLQVVVMMVEFWGVVSLVQFMELMMALLVSG